LTGTTYEDTNVTPSDTYYYKVEGVNTDGPGSLSNEAHATVPSRITASISKSCTGACCTFTSTSSDQGGTITTYSWTTTGATGSAKTFTHTFTSASTFSVALVVTDNESSTGNASVNVTCTQSRSFGFRSTGQLSCS